MIIWTRDTIRQLRCKSKVHKVEEISMGQSIETKNR
jgi:hypothetical protein